MPTLRSSALLQLVQRASEIEPPPPITDRAVPLRRTRANAQATRYSFTLNNYTRDNENQVALVVEENPQSVSYLIYGRETGTENATPHLQGFMVLRRKASWTTVLGLLPRGTHLEISHQTSLVNSDYCKKEGDWVEFGELPRNRQGNRTDLELAVSWSDQFIEEHSRAPTRSEWAINFPYIFLRAPRIIELAELRAEIMRPVQLVNPNTAVLRQWQQDIFDDVSTSDASDRHVTFLVDRDGGAGKTFLINMFMASFPLETQCYTAGHGKVADVAYDLNVNTKYLFFTVPRQGIEFLPYRLLESLKDRRIFSPKYGSQNKHLRHCPHIIVFSNEHPDLDKLSSDRYDVRLYDRDRAHFYRTGAPTIRAIDLLGLPPTADIL